MTITCTKFDYPSVEAELTIRKWFGLQTIVEKYTCLGVGFFSATWINNVTGAVLNSFTDRQRYETLNDAGRVAQLKYDKEKSK